jgi:hypothetical protein
MERTMFGLRSVDEVLEVRQAVARRHLEQRRRSRCPSRNPGDVVGGDREGEDAALGIARVITSM